MLIDLEPAPLGTSPQPSDSIRATPTPPMAKEAPRGHVHQLPGPDAALATHHANVPTVAPHLSPRARRRFHRMRPRR